MDWPVYFFLISCSPSGSSTASTQTSSVPVEVEDLFAQTRFLFVGSYNQKGSGVFILAHDASYAYNLPNELAKFSMWASLSANGQEILFDSGGDIFLADLTTGDVKLIIGDPSSESRPVWSPTGAQFAFERDNGASIYISHQNSREETVVASDPDIILSIGNWSPDGKEIIYAEITFAAGQEGVSIAPDSRIMIVNLETSQSRPLFNLELPIKLTNPMNPVFSPDGKEVAFQVFSDGHVTIFKADIDGRNVEELTSKIGDYSNPVWSPDGQYILAFTGGDIENYYSIFSTQEGNLVHTIHGLDGLITEWFLSKQK